MLFILIFHETYFHGEYKILRSFKTFISFHYKKCIYVTMGYVDNLVFCPGWERRQLTNSSLKRKTYFIISSMICLVWDGQVFLLFYDFKLAFIVITTHGLVLLRVFGIANSFMFYFFIRTSVGRYKRLSPACITTFY